MKSFFILLKDNLAQALKSKKSILFLILYFVVFALIVYAIKETQKEVFEQLAAQGGLDPELYRLAFNFMIEFLQINSNEILKAFLSIPLYSVELFSVMLLGTPLLILMVHYDKLAQETSDGTTRYLLFRTSRGSIYWAKFFSMIIEIALITLVATILAVVYGHYTLDFFNTGDIFWASLKYWAAGLMPLITFSSMVYFFSAWVKRPFLALLFSSLATIAALVMLIWVPELSPFNLDYWKGFFIPGTSIMLRSVLIYLGFTAVFLGAGFFIFKKRDL